MTLLDVLEHSGARVAVYDLGRRIGRIERAAFAAFEQAACPYPLPVQRSARFAVVQMAEREADQPVIWFLQLGLDELGLLILPQRDDLIDRLLASAAVRHQGTDTQRALQDNPYAFAPREDRMALFHALLSRDLDLPPSRYYPHALDYFGGLPGWEQWEFVGYQGIADVACRRHDAMLAVAVPRLPHEPLVALCHCLESTRPEPVLRDALIDRLLLAAEENRPPALIAALLRGLSGLADDAGVGAAVDAVLDTPAAVSIEILAAIAGRAWPCLRRPETLRRFLVRLAINDHGQPAFEHCVSDLLAVPDVSASVREGLRADDVAEPVAQAFSRMTGVRTPSDGA